MNRKQKIIVSITGIFLVLMILVGLTYGYFLTKITGNTNTSSINVTTAYLALKYDDGNKEIVMNSILPGTTVATKTFTVTNVGNGTVGNYVVALENVINELTNKEDLVYTLKCTSNNDKSPCSRVTNETYPSTNQVLVHNAIGVKTTHSYELTITYKETGKDQSIDMNKTIEGKVQIYDSKNIVDINGTVTNATEGDYVELHSDVKTSNIDSDSKYKIVGVFPGSHTLYVKNKEGEIRASKTIYINKGNEIDIDLDKLTITDSTTDINMDITINNGELEINPEIIENPYKKNATSLNYNIINNAIQNRNGTNLSRTPITTPGKEINKVYSYKDTYKELGLSTTYDITPTYQDYYWTYADSFTFDESTGKFSLINPKTCKYSECYPNLVGKYIAYCNTGNISKSTDILSNYTNLNAVYKLNRTDAPDVNREKTVYYNYYVYKNIPDNAERAVSITEDNDGNSYYYRGNIKDNYVNFAGMCWRIVRINGDGTTKLILEDKNTTCNSETYTGDNQYTKSSFGYTLETLNDGTKIYKNNFLNYENGMYDKLKEFQTTKLNDYLEYLSVGKWCYDDRAYSDESGTNKLSENEIETYYQNKKTFYYAPYVRLVTKKSPSLKCEGTELNEYRDNTDMYVGALTADELAFAGTKYGTSNFDNYLMNDNSLFKEWKWTLSPSFFNIEDEKNRMSSNMLRLFINAGIGNGVVESNGSIKPSINIKSNIEISDGDGTKENPYTLFEN